MLYQIFYTSHSKGHSISSAAPQTMDRDKVCRLLLELLQEEDDFLGIMDKEGIVLQFIRLDSGGFLVEMPNPDLRLSLELRLRAEDALDLMHHMPSNLANLDLTRFTKKPWPVS